jgi:hypothetical protein
MTVPEPIADRIKAAVRGVPHRYLAHKNPLAPALRIGQIGHRATDPEAIADVMQP